MQEEWPEVFICFGWAHRLRSCVVTQLDSFMIPEALETASLKIRLSEFI